MSGTSQSLATSAAPSGLNLMAAMNPRDFGKNTFSSSVMRALLYSHGLILEDPLLMAAELHLTSPAHTRSLSRKFIEAAVASMAEIEALLDAAVVQTYFVPSGERATGTALAEQMDAELKAGQQAGRGLTVDDVWDAFEAGYIDGLSPALRDLWRQIRAGDRNPPLDLVAQGISESDVDIVRTFIEVVAHLRPPAVVKNTIDVVSSALDDLRRLGGHHDILCASPLFADLLFLGACDPVAQTRVHPLARTPVPNLDQLSVRDIVAIRTSSDAFATWRARLSIGLERAHRLRDDLGPDVDTAAAVAEVLADARQQVLAETRTSRVLGRGGMTAFVAGALGGVVSNLAGGPTAGLLGAAGGLIPALAQGLLDRRAATPAFVRRHYLVFDRAS
jgi:hypothetical protein